ncbi:MAG TPA: class I SAM-dependent methyltransferase [Anaerolineales bacterium]|nr:class I SAM-dependent methyltransferase [Anaerolineales bacterium]
MSFFDSGHETAFRLFNGFAEGYPDLVADLYSRTLILYNYSNPPEDGRPAIQAAKRYFLELFPWLKAIIVKTRKAANPQDRRGRLIHGDAPDRLVKEAGVLYAVDLMMNQDSSFYLDTRELRAWAIQNLAGKRVLNTFAYTGSLGVAALAGGASSLVQLDKSRKFLKLAELSYELNGLPSSQANTIVGDYYSVTRGYRLEGRHFDCVFLDPPYFSTTTKGKIDLAGNFDSVLNKVRPLVAQDGILVAINNAIYVSGADYFSWLERLCSDGYLSIESLIPVPLDITGYPETIKCQPPVNPAPFNHSTKIALLRISRK